ncbi:MAG: AAA family ATPase [Candidatus Omnitrophica bacterium]|nr:AAA family ATPase [Candidatus Omnitrophota bacterium]
MRAISVVNQKGGCGKTTTSVNVAACLAFLGKKVLVVDMDSQAHSTLSLGVDPDELKISMFDVLDPENETTLMRDVIVPIEENLDLAPSQTILSVIEQKLAGLKGRERQLQLALAPLKENYDFILIDCPPSISILTFNALCAADDVLVPVEPSYLSVHGLKKLMETIDLVNEVTERPEPLKVKALITLFDKRTSYAKKMSEQIREMFACKVFMTPIRKNVKLQEAAEHGTSIVRFNRDSHGFEDYIGVTMEILEIKQEKQEPEQAEVKSYTMSTEEVPAAAAPAPQDEVPEVVSAETAAIEREDCLTDATSIYERLVFSINAPHATVVELAGDFTGWTPIPLRKDKNVEGMWTLDVSLKPGVYEYKFIVDSAWIADPQNNDTVDDTFGGLNSLVSFMPCAVA